MNRGIFMTPGVDEQWTLSVEHRADDLERYVDAFETFARDLSV
jgi:glutamate-1-semialdehyde 2,1-aminomutase